MEETPNSENHKKVGFISRHERLISSIAFVAGFIWDGLTLTYVNLAEAAIILGIYVAVIAVGIIVFQAVISRHESGWKRKVANVIPYVIQFMFGTLFNASLIFYTRSAELSTSWPFLLFLTLVIFGNELFRKRQERLTFQIVMFFIAEFLYFVFTAPIIIGKIGTDIFILSGIASLTVLGIVIFGVYRVARGRHKEARAVRVFIIIVVYVALNYAYFTNLIPPIPLALKDLGVFHSVSKINDQYVVKYEPAPPYVFWRKESDIFHQVQGGEVYIWSAVFAPTAFSLPIYHEWYYFNDQNRKWTLATKTEFRISGGRAGGYRGFTSKKDILQGEWRVDITTGNGGRLGRLTFTVVNATSFLVLETGVR